jgi:Tol biopolymer transport system component
MSSKAFLTVFAAGKSLAVLLAATSLGLMARCESAGAQTGSNDPALINTSTQWTLGAPMLASSNAGGVAGNGFSLHPNFSPDRKHLLFWSNSTNLVPGATNGELQLYIKDLTTGAVALVSAAANGVQGNNVSIPPNNSCQVLMFSPDGTKVVFESGSTDLVPDGTNGNQIFVKDLTTGAVTLVSADANGGQGNGNSLDFAFSPDGTKVAFDSSASNLVSGATHTQDIFVKDLLSGAVTLVSADANGEGNNVSSLPVFSPDAKKVEVAFASTSTNLVPGVTSGNSEIYVKNLVTGEVTLVSADANGVEGNNFSWLPQFSPDGTKVAFASFSGNLVPGGANGSEQVYLKDLTTGAVTLVSSDANGVPSDSGNSQLPVFSPDGTKIAFESAATNLVPGSTGEQVFVKDLATGAVILASTDANGVPGNSFSSDPNFSPDQTAVAFQSAAGNFGVANGTVQILVRQISAAARATTTALMSSSNPSVYGQGVTFTATVTSAAGTPSGSVTFFDGTAPLGPVTLNPAGIATFATSSLVAGSHSITASYAPSGNFIGSTSSPLAQTVTPAALSITANNVTKILNAPLPAFSATYSGFVNGETSSVLTGVLTCTTPATASSPAGTYAINCFGQSSNNYAITYVPGTLSIRYQSVGMCDGAAGHQILPPVDPAGMSVFKQGRTVPAKFRVCDANGVSIGTPGVVSAFFLVQIIGGASATTVEDVVDTNNPDTAFRWDPTSQQWIFNITTGNLTAGNTYVYAITLNDGTTINFQYGLR